MTIRGLIDACQPGHSLQSMGLDPCSCSMYYNISGLENKLICPTGKLFDHTRNKCRRAEEVKSHNICNPSDPLIRCNISSKYFIQIAYFCEGHIDADVFPVRTGYGETQTFPNVSQSTGTNTMGTQTSDFPHNRKEATNIMLLLMAMLSGAVIMLMLLLLVQIFRRFVKQRRSRPSCSANSSDEAPNAYVTVIYNDIEDDGESRCDSRQRLNSTELTLTMRSNDSQGNYYCCPDELIREEGAVGKTVPEGTLNYITTVSETKDGSVSNYQSQTCNARSEYSYADDTISFDHIRTESTYSYAYPFRRLNEIPV
ncbi:hypothetical protein CHS0354_039345 [Potamilus streckersoni]|uniref:Chitin-binding type-2 domain-containing protein n=1 Tax=Potamilus streckersoni TaxID=2493646 RepID=A0AAE0T3Q2_9BIVA|nr:hypothetical protein CHS0354_039345 [Potamilus streckersoni]